MLAQRLVLLALLGLCHGAAAQSGSRITEPAAPPVSRWQAEIDGLDQLLRDRAFTATEPNAVWVAGVIERGDPSARVTSFARVRVQRPAEMLFVASLAAACLEPLRPLPPECDATDRLADWATRDADNGVPALLLAERARQRNNVTAMIAHLEDAAGKPRFDDYSSRGALVIWEEVRTLPAGEPAARAELVASIVALGASRGAQALQALCRSGRDDGESARNACHAAGTAVAQRGATWTLRRAGARLAERTAASPEARTAATRLAADIERRAFECADAGNTVATAFASSDPAVRARAVGQWQARVEREARMGEVAACGAASPAKG